MASAGQEQKEELKLTGANAAKATVVFSVIAISYIGVLWGSCAIISPVKRIINLLPYPYLRTAYENGMAKAQHSPFLKMFPEQHRGKLVISFGEMLALKVIIGPFGLPLKLWLTYEIMKYIN